MNVKFGMIVIFFISFYLFFCPCAVDAKIVSVSADKHVLALNDDGTVWAWGDNKYGELGIGTTGDPVVCPQKVPIDNVTAISASYHSSLALKSDGTVWAWGYGDDGRIGDGGDQSRSTPVQVYNLSGITAIAAAGQQGFALKSDGTVWGWGLNRQGELGDGTTELRRTPVQVAGLTDVITLGENGRFAIKSDGTVWAWGENTYNGNISTYGALGDPSGPGKRSIPFQVQGVTNVTKIAYGLCNTVYVKEDGTVWGWGSDHHGAIGDGSISEEAFTYKTPSVKINLQDIDTIASNEYHNLALKTDGTVWFWGQTVVRVSVYDGIDLPETSTRDEPSPVKITGLDHVSDISSGFLCCIVVKEDGTIWGWGRNQYKELGDHKIVEPYPILIWSGPKDQISTSTAIATANTTSHHVALNTNDTPTPILPTVSSSPANIVPIPGFSLIAVLGSLFITIDLLSWFTRRHD